jgi:hypothetical protein
MRLVSCSDKLVGVSHWADKNGVTFSWEWLAQKFHYLIHTGLQPGVNLERES